MRTLSCLLLLVLLAPTAHALPLAHTDGTYRGLAHQGSRDAEADWGVEQGCISALTPYRITLALGSLASPGDVLMLEVDDAFRGVVKAAAEPGRPAVLDVVLRDGCPDFTVHGTQVRLAVGYTLTATPTA